VSSNRKLCHVSLRKIVVMIFAQTLICMSIAQPPDMPKSVQADLVKADILDDVKSNHFQAALTKFDELRKLEPKFAPPLLFLEAKVADKTGDSLRVVDTLTEYLNLVGRDDKNYAAALGLLRHNQEGAAAAKDRERSAATQAKLVAVEQENQRAEDQRRSETDSQILQAVLKIERSTEQGQAPLAQYYLNELHSAERIARDKDLLAKLQRGIDRVIEERSRVLAPMIATAIETVDIPAGPSVDIVAVTGAGSLRLSSSTVKLEGYKIARTVIPEPLFRSYLAEICKSSQSLSEIQLSLNQLRSAGGKYKDYTMENYFSLGLACISPTFGEQFVTWINRYSNGKWRLPTAAEYVRAVFGDAAPTVDFSRYDVNDENNTRGDPQRFYAQLTQEFSGANRFGLVNIGFGHGTECAVYFYGTDFIDVYRIGTWSLGSARSTPVSAREGHNCSGATIRLVKG
jgi:hypothetical protein